MSKKSDKVLDDFPESSARLAAEVVNLPADKPGPGEPRPELRRWDPMTGLLVIDEYGREVPDPTPMEPPIGWFKQPSMMDNVRAMVRSEHLRREAEAAGFESFEDAEDFFIEDDPADPTTPYEEVFDPLDDKQYQAALERLGALRQETPDPNEAAPAAKKPSKSKEKAKEVEAEAEEEA